MGYDSERLSAYSDIVAAGGAIQIIQSSSLGTFDPISETYARGSSQATLNHVAVFIAYSEEFVDDALIKKGDRQFLIPALLNDLASILTLTQDDKIVFGSRVFKIINENAVAPDGIPIIYKAQARE